MASIKDKEGKPIKEGETVSAKSRGGKHAGDVEAIVTNEDEASDHSDYNVKNPPKVLFEDQHGMEISSIIYSFRYTCKWLVS